MALCKPCLDRGRTTTAGILMGGEQWCTYCFTGEEHPLHARRRSQWEMQEQLDWDRLLQESNREKEAAKEAAKEAELAEECPFDYSSLVVWQQFFYKGKQQPKDMVLRTLLALALQDEAIN